MLDRRKEGGCKIGPVSMCLISSTKVSSCVDSDIVTGPSLAFNGSGPTVALRLDRGGGILMLASQWTAVHALFYY